MIDKPFAEIAKDDVDAIVTEGTPESRVVEFKSQLPGGREDERKEFLADVASFANASGGDLLYGIEEARDESNKPTGVPKTAPGLAGVNPDQAIQRLENMVRDGIAPRIPAIQMKAIQGFAIGPVIIVRVRKSWAAPHMIKGSPRFFSRNSNGKFPLDVTEIRAAFLNSQGLSDQIRQFRDERIGRILSGETPVFLSTGPLTVLHLIPVGLWASAQPIDVSAFINNSLTLPAAAGNRRPNLDGYLGYEEYRDGKCSRYTQLFRHGAVEIVARMRVTTSGDFKGAIPSAILEQELVHAIQDFMRLFAQMGVSGEIVAFFSMLGFRDCFLATNGFSFDHMLLRQDNLLFPELMISDIAPVAVPAAAKGLIDHVWQAFGRGGSPNYAALDKWLLG